MNDILATPDVSQRGPLALNGGRPIVKDAIPPLRTITEGDAEAVSNFMAIAASKDIKLPLSGYLAGSERGGNAVQRLENIWCQEFGVTYAIACNSGTSALMAACATLPFPHSFIVPTMGMSAAAAVPRVLGHEVVFADVDDRFCLDVTNAKARPGDVVIAVNLFGHPARLRELRDYCDARQLVMIEDNAQAPWAMEDGTLTGTVGHIGCFSFNVHKPFNTGEGGMVVTNDPKLAKAIRGFVNHGEVSGGLPGLNLRMTELTAVLGLTQLKTAKAVVDRRHRIWHDLSWSADNDGLFTPMERPGCSTAAYCFPLLVSNAKQRDWAVSALRAEGVPCSGGYTLMHKLPAFELEGLHRPFPNAEDLDSRLILIELCSIDPSDEQVEQMANAIQTIGGLL